MLEKLETVLKREEASVLPSDPIKFRQNLMAFIDRIIPYIQRYEKNFIYNDNFNEFSYNSKFQDIYTSLKELHDLTFQDVRDMMCDDD